MELVVFQLCDPVARMIIFEFQQTPIWLPCVPKPYCTVCSTGGKWVQGVWVECNVEDLITVCHEVDWLAFPTQIENGNLLIDGRPNQLIMRISLNNRDFFPNIGDSFNPNHPSLFLSLNIPNFDSLRICSHEDITLWAFHNITIFPYYAMHWIWMAFKHCQLF